MRETLAFCTAISVAWGLGYGGLWVTKWVVATLATGSDVIGNALGQVSVRSGMTEGEVSFELSRMDVLAANLACAFPKWSLKVAGAGVVAAVAFVAMRAKKGWRPSCELGVCAIGCAFVALLPVAWTLAFAQHSYVHTWFTYRNFAVLLIAVALAIAAVLQESGRERGNVKLLAHFNGGMASMQEEGVARLRHFPGCVRGRAVKSPSQQNEGADTAIQPLWQGDKRPLLEKSSVTGRQKADT